MQQTTELPDVQNRAAEIQVELSRVGIRNLKLPIYINVKPIEEAYKSNNLEFQHTVADVDCYVGLEATKKGANMSRAPVILQKETYLNQPLNQATLIVQTNEIRKANESSICELTYKFDYFIKKKSPVTKLNGIIHYPTIFKAVVTAFSASFHMEVEVPVTSLCPCSKEISNHGGAHNQRCAIKIHCLPQKNQWIWIEDLVNIAESSGSCQVYSILKRPDEKWVTDRALANPKFVEDIVREVYQKMLNLGTYGFYVEAISDESIHTHAAYARVEHGWFVDDTF